MPSWIGRLTHHDLKLNLSLTIMAISMFNLLQLFLEMTEEDSTLTPKIIRALPWLIGIHVTLITTSLALALINRLGHSMPIEEQAKDDS
ncbi:MAG: hypothetical protein HC808_11625 [Candidatus Competibacteraceae bacterium]|nr:hypothetical protein [Candidatus Competibacteraceae bacterium]